MCELEEKLVKTALDNGAFKAVVIPVESIKMSETFRDICKTNNCGMYGRSWTCPPDAGEVKELMDRARTYEKALMFQTVDEIEDSFDFEGMAAGKQRFSKVSQLVLDEMNEIFGEGNFWQLGAGGCSLCERCKRLDNEPCVNPKRALLSAEAVCFDVYNTTKDTDLKYINGANTVTYFGFVLFGGK